MASKEHRLIFSPNSQIPLEDRLRLMDMAAQAPHAGLGGLLFPQQGQGGTKSPSPKTGGSFPLPSFDDNGEYFPPTPVPVPLPRIDEPPPRNTLMPEKPIGARRLKDLLDMVRASGGVPKMGSSI